MSALWKAMLEAQKEIKHAIKDSKNPHLKNTYASLSSVLDTVKPIFNKNGIVFTQRVLESILSRDTVNVATRLTHAESGEFIEDLLPIPIVHKFKDGVDMGGDPQAMGSAITYGRRYGALSMGGIASEDDDGEEATVNKNIPAQHIQSAKPEARPADPVAVTAMTNKLNSALGFKKSNG